MKDHAKYSQLIWKALRDQLEPEDREELGRARLAQDADLRRVEAETRKLWELTEGYGQSFQPNSEAGLRKVRQNMAEVTPRPRYRTLRWLALAASLALLLAVGGRWLRTVFGAENFIEVATVAGEIKTLSLPDGSQVTLNEESRLSYPTNLGRDAKERRVRFGGEGYFRVEADAEHPFVIDVGAAEVKVVGTKFNLRAYPREEFTEVEVETGRVQLRDLEAQRALMLKRGQVGTLSKAAPPEVDTVANFNRQAWFTHKMNFKNVSVIQMIPLLERYYDIQLDHPPVEKFNCPVTADWENTPLPAALEALETLTNMRVRELEAGHYRLEGQCR